MDTLEVIAVEEHMWTPAIRDRLLALNYRQGEGLPEHLIKALDGVGDQRLADMDAMGVDRQVLSIHTPGTQVLEPADAVTVSREANDILAAVVAAEPARYACFATLPTPDPATAVDELERCVRELGHCGAMVYGRTGEKFIDHPDFAPIFDKAGQLEVPIYIHPQRPIESVGEVYYTNGLPPLVGRLLSNFAWGWHVETAVNAIRLILSGAFEQPHAPQIILGHWGELIPFFLERLDEVFDLVTPSNAHGFADTFLNHFHLSPSGMWSYPMLEHAIAEVGAERIMFSVDYPFIRPTDGGARRFLEDAPISEQAKHEIGHLNAKRLLHLK